MMRKGKNCIIIVLIITLVIFAIKVKEHLKIADNTLTPHAYSKEEVISKLVSRMKQERAHRSYLEQKEDYEKLMEIFEMQKEAFNIVLAREKKHGIEPALVIYFEKGKQYLTERTLKFADPVKCITIGDSGIDFKYTNFDMYLLLLSDRKLYHALKTINKNQMISVVTIERDERFNQKEACFILDKSYFNQEDQVAYTSFEPTDEDYGILLDDIWRLSILGENVFDWPSSGFLPAW